MSIHLTASLHPMPVSSEFHKTEIEQYEAESKDNN